MCSVSVVTVVFIHTMEDDQRLNTLVHEGDTINVSLQHSRKTVLSPLVIVVQLLMSISLSLCVITQITLSINRRATLIYR